MSIGQCPLRPTKTVQILFLTNAKRDREKPPEAFQCKIILDSITVVDFVFLEQPCLAENNHVLRDIYYIYQNGLKFSK
jgi:hypothetical protein